MHAPASRAKAMVVEMPLTHAMITIVLLWVACLVPFVVVALLSGLRFTAISQYHPLPVFRRPIAHLSGGSVSESHGKIGGHGSQNLLDFHHPPLNQVIFGPHDAE